MYFFIIIIVLTSIFISVKFYRWNRIKTSSMGEYSRVTTAINKIKKGTTEQSKGTAYKRSGSCNFRGDEDLPKDH